MTWILTATGRRLDLLAPTADAIDPYDIAWALAQTNRFTGHALRPYSVAEHSLLVVDICERILRLDAHGLLAALLHDGHEAYCGDQSSPAKAALGEPWHNFEGRLQHAVRGRFGLHVSASINSHDVKLADLIALATERRDLMPHRDAGLLAWPCLQGIDPASWVNLHADERQAMAWEDWRDAWLDKFHELEFARAQALAA